MTERDDVFGLSEIGQIALTVTDLDAGRAFYGDLLGVEPLFDAPGLAFFRCGKIRLMLGLPEGADGPDRAGAAGEVDSPSSIVYFRVPDIQEAHDRLQGRGVEFDSAPHLVHRAEDHELWLAFFSDPAGNALALMSELPSAGGT